MSNLIAQLKRHEAVELKPYKCTSGKLTIGVGRILEDIGITEEDAELRMVKAIDTMEQICKDGVSVQALGIAQMNQKILFSRARTVRDAIKKIMTETDE